MFFPSYIKHSKKKIYEIFFSWKLKNMYKGRDLGKKKNLNISRHLRAMPMKSGAIFIAGAIFFADTVLGGYTLVHTIRYSAPLLSVRKDGGARTRSLYRSLCSNDTLSIYTIYIYSILYWIINSIIGLLTLVFCTWDFHLDLV